MLEESSARYIVAGPRSHGISRYLKNRHEQQGCGYWFIPVSPPGLDSYRTSDFLGGLAAIDPRSVLPLTYYNKKIRAAVRREAPTATFDSCYERVRGIVEADRHPERLSVIAETPEFVIYGEPGLGDSSSGGWHEPRRNRRRTLRCGAHHRSPCRSPVRHERENRDAAELAFEIASNDARTLYSLLNGGTKEICLDADDMKCLTRGGSIDYEVTAGTVSLSIAKGTS
jgi:hypothetical protein